MLRKTSALGIVIALIVSAGMLFMTACTDRKASSDESVSVSDNTQDEGKDSDNEDLEGLSVEDEFIVTINENQGVDGF